MASPFPIFIKVVNIDMEPSLSDQFPFLTGIRYGGDEYVGVVVNHDNAVLTFYDISKAHSGQDKTRLLELGEAWWWESNRMLPIDVFLRHDMKPFRYCITTLAMKDVEILFGPTVSMQDLITRRVKRRSIQLVRRT
jgi:hypothetical protein